MRASAVFTILCLAAEVALSVALALPAMKYASLFCCICDAQVLSFFADLSVLVGTRARKSRPLAGLLKDIAFPGYARACPRPRSFPFHGNMPAPARPSSLLQDLPLPRYARYAARPSSRPRPRPQTRFPSISSRII